MSCLLQDHTSSYNDSFFGHLHFTVYASLGCCFKVKVLQIHTQFTATFALPSSFRVSSSSIYNLSLVGRMLVVIFFSTVMWNRYVLSCFLEIWGKQATDFQTRLGHLLRSNKKNKEKIINYKMSHSARFSWRTVFQQMNLH